jgi:hypothetical protein
VRVDRRIVTLTAILALITTACAGAVAQQTDTYPATYWPSKQPADCPFERSESLSGIVFTGRHASYTGADTWYLSWASDDVCYSTWTDGEVNGVTASSGGEGEHWLRCR